jgi:hypothetical protein
MDKIDKKMRAILLKPIGRGKAAPFDETSRRLLKQLENRAINDVLVQIGAEKLNRNRGAKRRTDLERASDFQVSP